MVSSLEKKRKLGSSASGGEEVRRLETIPDGNFASPASLPYG